MATEAKGEWCKATPTVQVGQQVKLPSGGPTMTVTHVAEAAKGSCEVTCAWFDEPAAGATEAAAPACRRESFPHAALLVQKPEEPKDAKDPKVG